ncbi:MAG: PQQ-like beta-propeller repeat protein, partial [Holophagales bacterium]|nr:PQQ-like beta-propeller repeat protein [Holophagales bacterium]
MPARSRPCSGHAAFLLLFLSALTVAVPGPSEAETPGAAAPSAQAPAPDSGKPVPWPQWRGPERDGRVAGDAWPVDLAGLEQLWRVPLQPSYSGPIVARDRVFTTETRDRKTEVVSAYDRATGERLWATEWQGAMKVPFFAAKNGSWIRSTPAFDGSALFVGGMLEVLVALDGATGEIRWKIDFPRLAGVEKAPFGFVCSPLLDGDHLYLEAAGSLWKLNKDTGEVMWRTEGFSTGGMASEGTFSSPVLAELG